MHAARPSLSYRPDIDGLRAVAVLAVLGYHAFPGHLPGGFAGVDIFFVISGFLITRLIMQAGPDFRFGIFYARRIRRLFPALLLVMATIWACGWFMLTPGEYAELGTYMAGGAGFAANVIAWQESDYFDNAAITKPLLHLWSLGVEEQFYLLWPALLYAALRLRAKPQIVVVLLAALSFLLAERCAADCRFYSPVSRFWEFALGGWLATHPAQGRRGTVAWPAAVLLVLSLWLPRHESQQPAWLLAPALGAALLILQPGTGPGRLLGLAPLVWVGRISYPLYLWHWPLLSLTTITYSGTPPAYVRLGALLASGILASLTYYALERPVRFGALGRQRATLVVLCAFMACAGAAGYGTAAHDGFAFRWANALNLRLDKAYYNEERQKRLSLIRSRICHVHRNTSFDTYDSKTCLQLAEGRKNILIMGDSHAADMYAALAAAYPEFHFLQATGAGCYVELATYEACGLMLGEALRFAQTHPLDAVLVAGHWSEEGMRHTNLKARVEALKASGQHVIIAGPPLMFTADIMAILARMPQGDDPNQYARGFIAHDTVTPLVQQFARDHGIDYLDRVQLHCGAQNQCDVTDYKTLYLLDYGHLTVAGNAYLAKRIRAADPLGPLLRHAGPP